MSAKPTVLFVDDEQMILQGLRRMLRGMRDEWSMEFIDGGRAALDRLDKGPVDVIVSDMRMPGIDGAKILTRAAEVMPESIRMILSGYAEQDKLLRALGPAHQILAKPVDPDKLIAVIREAVALRDRLPRACLRALTARFDSLPVPSEHYFALIEELDNPLTSANAIGAKIDEDLGMTTQILRLANSAYFYLPRRAARARDAVEMLGIETIRALLTISNFYLTDSLPSGKAEDLSMRSLRIGRMARETALELGLDADAAAQAATAGLLSHIGTLVLHANAPTKFTAVTDLVDQDKSTLIDAERHAFRATHAELGAYLAAIWGFAIPIVEAIAFHHEPSRAGPPKLSPLTAVHIAQSRALIDSAGKDEDVEAPAPEESDKRTPVLDWEYLNAIGYAAPEVE